MLKTLFRPIIEWYMGALAKGGYALIGLLMAIESSVVPLPSEVVIPPAAHLAHTGQIPLSLWGIVVAGTVGSWLGATLMYWAARLGGRPVIDRFAKILRIDSALINKAEEQMQKWGSGLVLIGRVIPGIRTLISIPAGLAKISFFKFFAATFIGAYIWCTLLIGAGYVLGHEWMLVSEAIKEHLPLVLSLGLFTVGAYVAYQYRAHIPALAWMKTKRMDNE